MTAPVWMAFPPEVHSASLSSGPGPASLLAAAAAWQSLSSDYASTAAELAALLASVQAGSWEGPSAEEYVAAHGPYLAWLAQASADSAAAAAQHETAAAAYTTALAAMPTLAELGANHVVHGVLVGTNFFGINTIPITLNEADYVRMWVQAAVTMGTYQAVSSAAAAAVPQTSAAPAVVKADGSDAAAQAADSTNPFSIITEFINWYIGYLQQLFGPIIDFLQDPIGNTENLIYLLLTNPQEALAVYGPFLSAIAYQVFSWVGAVLTYPQLLLDPLLAIAVPVVIAAAQQLLDQILALFDFPDFPDDVAPAPAAHPANLPAVGLAPTTVASPSAPASTAPAGTSPAGAPASAAPAAPAPLAYAVGGFGPDGGFSPTVGGRGGIKAPAAVVPAAAAGVSVREKRRARRRRTDELPQRQHADEYLDYEADSESEPAADPLVSASERGAGQLGFGGTAAKEEVDAAGLMALPADAFGGGPTSPMLPASWDTNGDGRH